jgi:glyoxylate utilization-related uncharacterized protein
MARPHVEFIQEQALAWERAKPVSAWPDLHWKVLSREEDGGAFTALVSLAAGWRAAAPAAFAAAQEFYVIDGELDIECAGRTYALKPGGYLRVGPGAACGPLAAAAACRLLWITDGWLEPFEALPPSPESVTFTDAAALEWQIPWVKGPAPGLRLKLLWRDAASGAYSRLLSVDPGWSEPRLEHHDVSEEAFVLEGDMTMGALGTMRPGAYFWRPPRIRHGPMRSTAGAVILIRTDGALFNYYTAPDGTPLNY